MAGSGGYILKERPITGPADTLQDSQAYMQCSAGTLPRHQRGSGGPRSPLAQEPPRGLPLLTALLRVNGGRRWYAGASAAAWRMERKSAGADDTPAIRALASLEPRQPGPRGQRKPAQPGSGRAADLARVA